ncbi:MAG TPA: hypothetical protein VME21_10510 [Steroidobacteraceae bacterium]|nr:hypothetical protein [Steroidobacteraceae bacterium]
MGRLSPTRAALSAYLGVALFSALALSVDSWPHLPRTPLDWALLLLIALPVSVLGDWLTDGALSRILERKGRGRGSLFFLRLGQHLALYVLFGIASVAVFDWLRAPHII